MTLMIRPKRLFNSLIRNFRAMTKHIFTKGNVTTTLLDLTEGIGQRSPEEILSLTQNGTLSQMRSMWRSTTALPLFQVQMKK